MGGKKNRVREGEREEKRKALDDIIRTPGAAMCGLINYLNNKYFMLKRV